MKKMWRRFLAGICTVALLMTSTGFSVMADEDESIFADFSEDVSVIEQSDTEEQGAAPDEGEDNFEVIYEEEDEENQDSDMGIPSQDIDASDSIEESISDESLTTEEEILDQSVAEEVVGDVVSSMDWTYINPVYDQWIAEQDLRPLTELEDQSMETDDYYSDDGAAAVYLSEEMEKRSNTIIVNYRTKKDYHTFGMTYAVLVYIFETAVNFDSGATEGDYLFFQYGGWNGHVSVYDPGDGYYYYSMTYAVTYFTDATQERAVTEEVSGLIDSWNLHEKSTYEKVKTVYDYLVQNVIYREDCTFESSTAYAALINKSANSYGFYTAMYRLLQECRVQCRIITGKDNIGTDTETKCAWNAVKIGSRYFNADPALEAEYYSDDQNYSYFLTKEDTSGTFHFQDEYLGGYRRYVSPFSETDYVALEKPPVWIWSQDCSSATVTFNQGLFNEVSLNAEISTEILDDSEIIYTAKVLFNGEDFTDTITREPGDVYGEPVWEWDGNSKATAVFTSITGADIQRKEATVSWYAEIINQETGVGRIIYDATVGFGGRLYSDKKHEEFTEQVYVCDTRDDIVQRGREAFRNCETGTTFLWPTDIGVTLDDIEELKKDILEHTGNPDEGDYLKRNILGFYNYLEDTIERSGREYYAWGIANRYRTTTEQEQELSQWIDNIIAGFGFNDTTTDYEKFMTIYDYICNHVSYDDDEALSSHSAYAAAIYGVAVCEGYSTLLYRMLLEVGVDNRIIIGEIAKNELWISLGPVSSMGHAWNIVKIGALYYETDPTWDASHVGPDNPTASLMYDNCLKASLKVHDRDEEYDTEEFKNAYPVSDISCQAVPHAILGDGLMCKVDNKILYLSGEGYIKDFEFNCLNRPWTDQITKAVIEDGVTGIGQCSFKDMWKLKEVIIPGSVKRIKQHAFFNCRELELLKIGEGVEKIDNEAFFGCYRNLTRVEIPGSVKEIGAAAFSSCDQLSEVVLNDGIRIIGNSAFRAEKKDSLTQITIPGSVIEIGEKAIGYYLNGEGSYNNIEPIPGFKIYGYDDSAAETYAEQNGFEFVSLGEIPTKDISECTILLSDEEHIYDGKEKTPNVTVKDGESVLDLEYDYTITYRNNINAGTAEVLVNGVGKYEGSKAVTFSIAKASPELCFAGTSVSKTIQDATFTNELTKTTDGNVTFSSSNVEVATVNENTGEVSIKGAGSTVITATSAESDNYEAGSAQYTLTVKYGTIEIISQPESCQEISGKRVNLVVEAVGDGLNYQWQYLKKGRTAWADSGLSSAHNSTLTFKMSAGYDGMQFRCVLTDENGQAVTSDEVTATMISAPEIVEQPGDAEAALGETVKISVTASGTDLAYQWQYQKAGGNTWKNSGLSSAANATLKFKMSSGYDGMKFRCKVTNADGLYVYSDVVSITLTEGPSIVVQPLDVNASLGTMVQIKTVAEGTDLTYSWQYQRPSTTAWNKSGLSSASSSTLSFKMSSGYDGMKFRCKVTNAAGRVVYTDVSVVKIAAGPAIVEQPKDVTVEAGNKAEFSVLPSGEGLTYQWQYQKPGKMTWVNSGSSGNKTARVKVTGTTGTNGMKFRCIVMDGDGNITISNYATLTVMLQ